MGTFFDTGVFIGFTYCDDHWRNKAEIAINADVPKFTSPTVLDEYREKHRYNQRVRRRGLIEFRDRVERSITSDPKTGLIDMPEIESMVPPVPHDEKSTDWLMDIARRLAGKAFTKVELIQRIKRFMDVYFAYSTERYDRVAEWCSLLEGFIECNRRFKQYPVILDAFVEDGMTNENDNEIILDAHDLCTYCQEGIDLVTGDHGDIISHKETILRVTKIRSVVYLGNL